MAGITEKELDDIDEVLAGETEEVAAGEVLEEENAIEILVTWKSQRDALSQEQLKRGFRPAKPDIAKMTKKVRCYRCRKSGHFSKNCRRNKGKGRSKGK